MSEHPRLPDVAWATAGLTGLWFLLGLVQTEAYLTRMGIPRWEVPFPPHVYIYRGFLSSLLFFLGAGFALLILEVSRAGRLDGTRERNDSSDEMLLTLLLAGGFYLYGQITSFAREPFRIGRFETMYTIGQVTLMLVFLATTILLASMKRWWERRPSIVVPGKTSAYLLAATLLLVTLAWGAEIEGRRQAGDELWHLSPHTIVHFNSTTAPELHNTSHFFIVHANGGYYVRDANDIGGKDANARFVGEGLVDSVRFERRAPDA